MDITVECVWCNTKTEFNRFVRLHDECAYVINYIDVTNKLMKADQYGHKPSDHMIGLHIHGQIKMYASKLQKFEEHPKAIIYLIKRLNADTIKALKSTVTRLLHDDTNITINLTIINRDDYPKRGVLSNFDSVKFIDK